MYRVSRVKFIVILLIMRFGVILNCCVKPVRPHKCTAGAACAKNPYHCKECHKDTWVESANARRTPDDINEFEDKSDEDIQTTTDLDDFIDNEIPRKEVDTGSSSEDLHILNKVDRKTYIRTREPEVPLIFLNASYARPTIPDTGADAILETPADEDIDFTQEKPVKEQIETLEEQIAIRDHFTFRTTTWRTFKPTTKPTEHHQRGVLDMILPQPRVLTFKRYFDSFRRFLSNSF